MSEKDVQTIGRQLGAGFLCPFDRRHRASVIVLRQAGVLQSLGGVESIEIRMGQPQTAVVFMNEHERGAAHRLRRGSQPFGHAAHQRGLAGPQVAVQRQGFAALERPADPAAKSMGVRGRS